MNYFQEYHKVQWPEGSEIVMDGPDRLNSFYVRNTRQQLSKMEHALSNMNVLLVLRYPLEISLIAFHKEDIEPLHTKGMVTAERLRMLHKRGRSKMLSNLKVLIPTGQEDIIKDTQELLYPTRYSPENSSTNIESGNITLLLPENFTMREVGTTCSSILETSSNDDGLFILSMRLEYTSLTEWTSFEGLFAAKNKVTKEMCAQPVFACLIISGRPILRPKETVLVGGGTLDTDWVGYVFVTLDTPVSVNSNEIRSTSKVKKEVTK